MFKFFYILHWLKNKIEGDFSIPEKKCLHMDSGSLSVWGKWGIWGNLLGCQTLMTLLTEWFWSVKAKTVQTYDKCLRSGSSVFTLLRRLAFRRELWLKMKWMPPKLILNTPWKSHQLTAIASKAHRLTGTGRQCRRWGPSFYGNIYS